MGPKEGNAYRAGDHVELDKHHVGKKAGSEVGPLTKNPDIWREEPKAIEGLKQGHNDKEETVAPPFFKVLGGYGDMDG